MSAAVDPATTTSAASGRRGVVRALSVAPMMARTDRHFRYFMRRMTKHTLLYTEMVTMGAVIHGDRDKLLGFHPDEHPIALQLGGDNPEMMAQCARIAEDWGYDEVNINVGCPSDRVQNGNFGACLMAQPERVRDCVAAMRAEVSIPVTVKHRIGIDDIDQYEDMARFVDIVRQADSDRFSVHARKAWLQGLSPKENRNIPPLRYDEVHRLKREFPDEVIEINGGIKTIEATNAHLEHVDAVMIGRAAYENPYLFATADRDVFGDGDADIPDRFEVVEAMIPYVERYYAQGWTQTSLVRHLLPLFHGLPGTRIWKRTLSTKHTSLTPGQVLQLGIDEVRERLSRRAS